MIPIKEKIYKNKILYMLIIYSKKIILLLNKSIKCEIKRITSNKLNSPNNILKK